MLCLVGQVIARERQEEVWRGEVRRERARRERERVRRRARWLPVYGLGTGPRRIHGAEAAA